MLNTDLANDHESIESARIWTGHTWRELPVVDDGWGQLYLAGMEYGAMHLIRATSWESAYEAWVDELPPVPDDEIHEAYGLNSAEELAAIVAVIEDSATDAQRRTVQAILDSNRYMEWNGNKPESVDDVIEYPLPIEGYRYQSNATGTGIVNVGHYEWLRKVNPDDVIVIVSTDDDDEPVTRWSHLDTGK